MNFDDYQELATRTANTKEDVLPLKLNWALGLCGEAGEVAELIKKRFFHGHDIYEPELVDELGDALWYLAVLAESFGVRLDTVARRNVAKLRARYPDGFSQERSRERDE